MLVCHLLHRVCSAPCSKQIVLGRGSEGRWPALNRESLMLLVAFSDLRSQICKPPSYKGWFRVNSASPDPRNTTGGSTVGKMFTCLYIRRKQA